MGDQPIAVTVVTETRNLKTQPFVHPDVQITTGKAWEEWIEGIEREFRYFRITEPVDKKDALIIYGGKEVARLEKSLPNPTAELNEYDKLKTKLNEYFTPKKNKHHTRYLFLKMKPNTAETTAAYSARLREKANECEVGETCDDRILEHLIQTIDSKMLIHKAINKKWSLTQMLAEAAQIEDTSLQIQKMKSPDEASSVAKFQKQQRYIRKPTDGKQKFDKSPPCNYCGLTGVHSKGKNCPASGKKCNKCQRWNHFANVCRADTPTKQTEAPQQSTTSQRYGKSKYKKNQVKKTTAEEEENQTSSDDEFFDQAVKHLKQV